MYLDASAKSSSSRHSLSSRCSHVAIDDDSRLKSVTELTNESRNRGDGRRRRSGVADRLFASGVIATGALWPALLTLCRTLTSVLLGFRRSLVR
jgi:hypothetical protein